MDAHVVNIVSEQQPGAWVYCYRAEVSLLRVTDPELMATLSDDPRFEGARVSEREEAGEKRSRPGRTLQVLLIVGTLLLFY